jgi:hypothetical protein
VREPVLVPVIRVEFPEFGEVSTVIEQDGEAGTWDVNGVSMKTNFRKILGRKCLKPAFALVVTLSLMVLLTIIATGLLGLSSITLRKSGRDSDVSAARANARLGLMIAINQLQKTLGPDQRVTANADLKFPAANLGKWVGVYGNESVADYSQKPSAIPTNPYKPVLLNWLVSGNESVSFTSSEASGSFGAITTPPSSIPYGPTDAVSGLNGLVGDITIRNRKAALLVGSGSVVNPGGSMNYVAAPIVAIKDSTTSKTTGGYAYWVGDDGMKARIDLRENYRQQTTASQIDKGKGYSFVTSQRSGIEMMSRDGTASSKIGDDYDPANEDIKKLVSTGQFPLLSTNLTAVLKSRFHDITAFSKGVLSDSYAGGLKKEMKAALYGGQGPANGDPVFTPESSSEFALPTWGHIRSWANFTEPAATPPPFASGVRPQTATQTRFGPVISMAAMGLGVQQVPGSPNTLRVQLYPVLILWNPYTVGIPPADYEIGYKYTPSSSGGDAINVLTSASDAGPWANAGSFNLSSGDSAMSSGSGYFRFTVKGSKIPAGESHVYLAENVGSVYSPGASTLIRAPDTAPIGYNTRYLATNKTFTFTGADPFVTFSGSYPNGGNMTNGDRQEVVLTTPGGLSSGFSSSTPVYQVLTDMNLFNRIFPAYSGTARKLSVIGQQAHLVLRTQIMMEARGGFSSDWRKVGAMLESGSPRGQERNRWIASQNPTAPYIKRTKLERDLWRGGAFSHGSIASGDLTDQNNMMVGVNGLANYLAGVGGDQSGGADAPLLDILPSSAMLLSLGQLQHAQLNPYVFGTTYPFGNAGANVDIPRAKQYVPSYVARPGDSTTDYKDPLYDISWHTNRAIWDRYFISSADTSLSQGNIDDNLPLPNARMVYYRKGGASPVVSNLSPGSGAAYDKAAANLLLAGAFNVNSTSIDAWRAVLTGTNKLSVPSEFANPLYASQPLSAMMPRFSRDVRSSDGTDYKGLTNMWSNNANSQRFNMYRGNRELLLFRENGKASESTSDAQDRLHLVAAELATKIVEEVRLRGPFLSLGDFVNRDLETTNEGIRGALQAAIDRMASNQANPTSSYSQIGAFVDDSALNNTIGGWDPEHYMGTPLSEKGNSSNSRTAMAPKHLTQADILSTIGPALSARSDTFTIRSYGEALDKNGIVTAQEWCEAVVQRTPEYVDASDEASVAPQDLTATANKKLGRRIEVVSFRWLSKNEL